MTRIVEIKIPDIGDFKDVPVIEVLVAPGASVEKETSLITLETDKASMEVPSPHAGVIKEIKVKVGDKVSEGSVILTLTATEQSEGAENQKKKPESTGKCRLRPRFLQHHQPNPDYQAISTLK